MHLILIRKHNKILCNADTDFIEVNNEHVFAYTRRNDQGQVLLALVNFSEDVQSPDGKVLTQLNASSVMDLISKENIDGLSSDIQLLPYQVMWLIGNNEIKASSTQRNHGVDIRRTKIPIAVLQSINSIKC